MSLRERLCHCRQALCSSSCSSSLSLFSFLTLKKRSFSLSSPYSFSQFTLVCHMDITVNVSLLALSVVMVTGP